MNQHGNNDKATISLFTREQSWIEGEALRQLEAVAALPGMLQVAGFPDLHPGKGGPVGAAMLSENMAYPYLIGSDAGCSVALYGTGIGLAKAKPERWSRNLSGLEEAWDGDSRAWLEDFGVAAETASGALGTIGQGNHFAELQKVQEVYDRDAFEALDLSSKEVALVVHSGSRWVGEALLREHVDQHRDGGLPVEPGNPDSALERYLAGHEQACRWAAANRELIACRLLEQIGGNERKILEQTHNSLTRRIVDGRSFFLHRKGAAPSDNGALLIPGSRGTASYLVLPSGSQERNLWSVAHGAGRKWSRSECEGRLRDRHSVESLQRTKLGSYVICEDRDLLYEEMELAYKSIDAVIEDMASHGLITVVAKFTPLLTYKTRRRH